MGFPWFSVLSAGPALNRPWLWLSEVSSLFSWFLSFSWKPLGCQAWVWQTAALETLEAPKGVSKPMGFKMASFGLSKLGIFRQTAPWGGACETKSKKGRARDRTPSMHRAYSAQRGNETMVSEGARPWGRGRSEFAEFWYPFVLLPWCPFGCLHKFVRINSTLQRPFLDDSPRFFLGENLTSENDLKIKK